MKPASALLLDVLLFLSASLAITALVGIVYGTLGDRLSLPEPLPKVENIPATPSQSGAALAGMQGGYDAAGLVIAEGYDIVKSTCTACHSAQLVIQNRANRAGWEEMIRWMQAKQGLWDLGANHGTIVDYLVTHYGIEDQAGRRPNLEDIAWYVLDLE